MHCPTSGVGTQTRHLVSGLLNKSSDWTFRQFGAALKHSDYETIVVNEDFIIKPIDGFGDRDTLRIAIATEKPDILLIFTDPRFFIWLFEMEDEIHQVCPIVWWHVWDNYPYPKFNEALYKATDKINCHSYLTYEMLKDHHPGRTGFIPHAVPEQLFYPMSKRDRAIQRGKILGDDRSDHLVGIWVNRNAKRKRPNDVLLSWKYLLDRLEKEHGHRKATLIMHTDPMDQEGPNLTITSEMLNIHDNVFFSRDRIEFDKMNILYNISDFCLNVSYAEGFGLSTLECMQAGRPIIAVKTGGLTRQVVDHRDGSENGIAIDIDCKSLVGSQTVPYIYEEYATSESISDALFRFYEMPESERERLGKKARDYVLSEFSYNDIVSKWHESLTDVYKNWKETYVRWSVDSI